MSADIKRMNYFDGLFLGSEDFNLEQGYNNRMRRLHNRRLHTNGIVHGLEVEGILNSHEIKIQPGLALDRYFDTNFSEETSRELNITDPLTVDLSRGNYHANDQIYIWIYYKELKSDLVSERGGNEPIHWLETIGCDHSTTKPLDENINIILARIILDNRGLIDTASVSDRDENDNTIRIYSGFSGKRIEAEKIKLTDPDISESFASIKGELFGDGERGIRVESPRTHLTGNLESEGNLSIDKQATIGGTLNVYGDVTAQSSMHLLGTLTVDQPSNLSDLTVENQLNIQGNIRLAYGATVNEISTDPEMSDNSNSAVPTEQAIKSYVDQKIASYVQQELVGGVMAFATTSPPQGWLECNGQAISRNKYATLFTRIGTIYGSGNGATTFNIPDLRGVFLRGWDYGRGLDPGRGFGNYQADQIQDHQHTISSHTHGYKDIYYSEIEGTVYIQGHLGSASSDSDNNGYEIPRTTSSAFGSVGDPTSSRHGSETRPRNVSIIFCIKY